MARPKNADGQRTRQAILDAALALFAEKGFFGTSLRDVAAAVGVRESALYNYFKNKEALFEALIVAHKQERDERMAKWEPAGPIADPHALLEDLALANLQRFTEPREQMVFRLVMSDGIRLHKSGRFNLQDRLGSGRAHLIKLMQRLVDEGWLRKADPNVLWMTFSGPWMLWRHIHVAGVELPVIRDPRAFARQHVAQFFAGAGTAPARKSPARPPRTRVRSTQRHARSARRQSS